MTVKPDTVTSLKLTKKAQVDYDKVYTAGFKQACDKQRVDPLKLFSMAKTLELHL